MTFEELHSYISTQKDNLDKAISLAAFNFYNNHKKDTNFHFEIEQSRIECYHLSKGEDLCYDRPSIGLSYSLWYQGRRINSFLRYLAKAIFDSKEEKSITLYDLGAGTGAIQWACGVIISGFRYFKKVPPIIKIINIDTSPFMLDYNRSYLWPVFLDFFPSVKEYIIPSYQVNSWSAENDEFTQTNSWITASYLFDHTENLDNLKNDFKKIIEKIKPSKILLTSSFNKKQYTNAIVEELKMNNYTGIQVNTNLMYSGGMTEVLKIRNYLNTHADCNFRGTPIWNEKWIYGVICTSTDPIFLLFSEDSSNQINLYNPPLIVRRDIVLNEQQLQAARNDNRPSIIVGPAGCGKSVVITQRIINIIEEAVKAGSISNIRILLTTFNKKLKYNLQQWIDDLLGSKKISFVKHVDIGFTIEGSAYPNIYTLHFDVLATRLWPKLFGKSNPFINDLVYDSTLKQIADEAIEIIKSTESITTKEYDNVLNSEYILDEYNRVIYGQNYTKLEVYLKAQRRGRPQLNYNGKRRELLFKTTQKFLEILEARNKNSVITRRHKLLKQLEKINHKGFFSHIFVDEFQDCTQTDYNIFYKLIKDSNNLVIAGDFAQAIHLGKVADIPRVDNEDGTRMRNRITHKLDGSYRLPYRISEAIKPLSESIKLGGQEDADIITPYKGAPPGARPILVYAENTAKMSEKIISIVKSFNAFDIANFNKPDYDITILERDSELFSQINVFKNNISSTDTILRLKGLEKKCIVWSTRSIIDHIDEIKNFIYTIFTRTSGLLIIAIFPNLKEEYKDIIKMMRQDRLIIWDQVSLNMYTELLFNS